MFRSAETAKTHNTSLIVRGIQVGATLLFIALLLMLGPASPAYAATLTVTTTGDTIDAAGSCAAVTLASLPGPDGQTSLREAVCAANSNPGADTITFGIPATGVQVITLASVLPNISDSVTIDGLTQLGTTVCPLPNGPLAIQIDGSNLSNTSDNGFTLGSSSTLRGLSIVGLEGTVLNPIQVESGGNLIECNRVGQSADGTTADGNPAGTVINSTGNIIQNNIFVNTSSGGGVTLNNDNNAVLNNTIANNSSYGIGIGTGATNNRILGNRISGNGGLGIELLTPSGIGVTANDPGDLDTGLGNNGQNFPVLTSAIRTNTSSTVSGTLNSNPSQTYRVEFFSSPACNAAPPNNYGEGAVYLGFLDTVTTDSGGDATFSLNTLPATTAGHVMTAVAINITPGSPFENDSSEFSACVTITEQPQAGPTFTVNTNDDTNNGVCSDTHCSLREAINAANAQSGANTITFNIPGAGPHTITVTGSNLPTITAPVTIDGTTQAGAGSDCADITNPLIVIDGDNTRDYGLVVSAGNSVIRGVVINGFTNVAVQLDTTGGNSLECNYLGLSQDGTTAAANGRGMYIASSDNTIGGASTSLRNVISGNGSDGITIASGADNVVRNNYIGLNAVGTARIANSATAITTRGNGTQILNNIITAGDASSAVQLVSNDNVIQGNFIGTNASGTAALGSARAINLNGSTGNSATNNLIGGTTAAQRNVLSGNGEGILIQGALATGNRVEGNYIGVAADGTTALANSGAGVRILTNASNNTIGGTAAGAGNLISFNGGDGVSVTGGVGNSMLGNLITANTGLGIDLADNGVTANDANDADTGPNNLQNFPVLSAAYPTVVRGTLNSNPNGIYRIEFFNSSGCDPSGNGEGQTYLGALTGIATDGTGNSGTFAFIPGSALAINSFVTATATRTGGSGGGGTVGDTSEFSACFQVVDDPQQTGTTLVVNVTNDNNGVCTIDDCSLREAITQANSNADTTTINFNIPGTGPHVINVLTGLPGITAPVTINGLSEPDITPANTCPLPDPAPNGLAIQIRDNGTGIDGLRLSSGSGGSTIRGLSITGFNDDAIEIMNSGGNVISCNYIGVAADGTTAGGNNHGIFAGSSAGSNTIGGAAVGDGNVIAHQSFYGVWMVTTSNTIRGNIMRNNVAGVQIDEDSNTIQDNDIYSNSQAGIIVSSGSNSTIIQNDIYNNGQDGVRLSIGIGNQISQNNIYNNGPGAGNLGIDLADNGVTANDANDADTGPNNLQNFPVLSAAYPTVVRGTLNSNPDGVYRIEFFNNSSCDPSGNGEGQTYLGALTGIATDGTGNSGTFAFTPDSALAVNSFVTATAIRTGGSGGGGTVGDTSEFSACFQVVDDPQQTGTTLVVNVTNDNNGVCSINDCSLREAITLANSTPGTDETITFNIPGSGPHTITPATSLPGITDTVFIDGLTQPANGGSAASCTTGPLLIEISTANGTVGSGLLLSGAGSSGSTIRGLAISGFNGNNASAGVIVMASSNNTIQCNFLGLNAAGTAQVNGGNNRGVLMTSATNNLVGTNGDGTNDANERNVISGNVTGVIIDSGSTANVVAGNYIGSDVTGSTGTTFGSAGIRLAGNATITNNIIGFDGTGTASVEGNLIRSQGNGISHSGGTGNRFSANRIYDNITIGIDLATGPGVVTPNDAGDPDTGANNLQNFPVLNLVTSAGVVVGSLDSLPINTAYPVQIEFFANTACDTSGNGEGEVYLGATSIAAPGSFSTTLTLAPGKNLITATAIDNDDNTSEFSACQPIGEPDLTVTKSHAGSFTQSQAGAQYTIVVSNTGTLPTSGPVTVVDTLPAGLTATALSGIGWSCTLATLTCTRSDALAVNSSYPAITLTVNVASNAPASVTNIVAVSGGNEHNASNNNASDPTTIIALGTITINKVVLPADDLGRFDLLIDSLVKAVDIGDAGSTGAITVVSGSHTVAEAAGTSTDLNNYTSVIDCGSGPINGTSTSVNVPANGNITCTITNTRKTGSLTVIKNADPADNTTFNFSSSIPGSASFSLQVPSNPSQTFNNIPTGVYVVTDDVVLGWVLDDISCDSGSINQNDNSITITLGWGDNITCTFKNVKDLAPDTNLVSYPADPTNNSSASFSFSGSDDFTPAGSLSFECALDSGGFSACTDPQIYASLADGAHTFQVRAIDAIGQADPSPASYTWTVDTTGPDTTFSTTPPSLSASTNASFSFAGSDDFTPVGSLSFECRIDGGAFVACTSPRTYLGLSDGAHTFQVRAIDEADNEDPSPATFIWEIDTTSPPAPVVITPANGESTNNSQPLVSGTAESNSTVTVFLDGTIAGTTTADASGNWTFSPPTPLSDSSHTVRAQAADALNNVSPDSNTNTFTVDTVAPDTSINTPTPANPTNSTSAIFNFSGNDGSGVGGLTFACDLDGSGFSACTSPWQYNGLADGSHTFQVRASDSLGNTDTTPVSFTWTVDTVSPDVVLSSLIASPTNSSTITVTITFNEPVDIGSGIGDLNLINSPADPIIIGGSTVYTFTLHPTSDGPVTAQYLAGGAFDAAGNANTNSNVLSIIYDGTAPTVTLTSTAPDPTSTSPIPVIVTFSESVTGFTASDIIPGNATVNNFAGSGSSYTFDLIPGGLGMVTANIAAGVAQDATTNPNIAATQFSRTFVHPEIAVLGNNIFIANGDTSPSPADQTNFGNVAMGEAVTHTFTISNSGNLDLVLSGSPLVTLSGPAASDFSVVLDPVSPIGANTTTSFQVRFTPTITGTRVAMVTIASNDSDENPYHFAIQGGGTAAINPSTTIYLPLIVKDSVAGPDLVVDSLSAGGGKVTLVIKNIGTAPVTDAFWVDVYVNPSQTPSLNKPWQDIAPVGFVWGVSGSGLSQLSPGGSLTLMTNDAFYSPQYSSTSPLPLGARVFALADSVNFSTSYGAVQEISEANNLRGPVVSSAITADVPPATLAHEPSEGSLPQR